MITMINPERATEIQHCLPESQNLEVLRRRGWLELQDAKIELLRTLAGHENVTVPDGAKKDVLVTALAAHFESWQERAPRPRA